MTLKLLSTTDDCIIMLQIETDYCYTLGTQTHPGHGMAIFRSWVPSCLLMKSFVWTTCAQGLDKQNSDCKVDGAHVQPGNRHPAGAKWHLNMRCIRGLWLYTQTAGTAMMHEIGSLKDSKRQTNEKD